MTTKEKIKTLMADFCGLSFALGYAANTKDFNSDVFGAIANARTDLEEVIFALCDELPNQNVFIGDSRAEPSENLAEPSEPLVSWTCGMCGRHLLARGQKVVCVCGHELSPKEKDRV